MRIDLIKRAMSASPKKQFNLFKIYFSYLLHLPKPFGMPIRLMVEPANFCNLACPTCPVGNGEIKKAKGLLSGDNFKKIIDEAGDYLYHLTLWNWGEPFLNAGLADFIKYARAKNIYVVTSTNGHFLNEQIAKNIIDADLNEIIIALDGLSQLTLERYRKNANIEQIISGIKTLVDLKKKSKKINPILQLQFIVMKHNEHELSRVEDFAKELGFDKLVMKTFGSHLDQDRLKEFEPVDKKFSRYDKQTKNQNDCKNIWLGMNINYDGGVVPCCYDPFEQNQFGNIFNDGGIKNIWQGGRFVNFRKAILNSKQNIGICKNCDFNKNINKVINLN